uniref:DUF2607 family protein n=1 Tax=Solibacter usitatus (strain Ellin6076) TaxID=234267 RepID=Q02AU3_SOLUE
MLTRGRIARILLVLLFLCAILIAQAESFASQHSHQHSSQHCCGLCHVGPLPLLQPVSSAGLAPIAAVAWLSPSFGFNKPYEALLAAGSSRAPPQFLLV